MPLPKGFKLDEDSIPEGFTLDSTGELRDAPAQPLDPSMQVAPSQSTATTGGSFPGGPPEMPSTEPSTFVEDVKKGFLTNEPVEGFAQGLGRNAPAMIGGMIGSPAGILGAGTGGAAGEALRQTAVSLAGEGDPTLAGAGKVVSDVGMAGAEMAAGEAIGRALVAPVKALSKFAKSRVVPIYKHIFEVPEVATERALKKGASKILTPEKASADLSNELIEKAQNAIVKGRNKAGKLIESAEDGIMESGAGRDMFDTKEASQAIRSELADKGYLSKIGKKYGEKSDMKLMKSIMGDLSKGPISGDDLILLKRFVDQKLAKRGAFTGEKVVGSDANRILNKGMRVVRKMLDDAYPQLAEGNKAYGKALDIEKKWGKLFGMGKGASKDPFATDKAFAKVRRIFHKGDGANARKILQEFDEAVGSTENIVSQLFDNITAQDFARMSPSRVSPSGGVLRGAAAAGMSPGMGGKLMKIGQAVEPVVRGAGNLAEGTVKAISKYVTKGQGEDIAQPFLTSLRERPMEQVNELRLTRKSLEEHERNGELNKAGMKQLKRLKRDLIYIENSLEESDIFLGRGDFDKAKKGFDKIRMSATRLLKEDE